MEILIEFHLMKYAVYGFNEVRSKYAEKISNSYRTTLTIYFKNGDEIKFISSNQHNDGRSADIAYGPHAQYFTCRSKITNPVWQYEEIIKHLDNM